MRLLLILLAAGAIGLTAAKIPLDAREAHKQADAILYPLLIAAMNEYALNHGSVNDPGHLEKLNAHDKENVRSLRAAFHNWDEAMKQAGY